MGVITSFVLAAALLASPVAGRAQENPPAASEENYFSGTVTEYSDAKITVSRSIAGQPPSTRTFVITPETKFEGKPAVRARVTVRFAASEEGDKAVHIIVRGRT